MMTLDDLIDNRRLIRDLYPPGTVFGKDNEPVLTEEQKQGILDCGVGYEDAPKEHKTPDFSDDED